MNLLYLRFWSSTLVEFIAMNPMACTLIVKLMSKDVKILVSVWIKGCTVPTDGSEGAPPVWIHKWEGVRGRRRVWEGAQAFFSKLRRSKERREEVILKSIKLPIYPHSFIIFTIHIPIFLNYIAHVIKHKKY